MGTARASLVLLALLVATAGCASDTATDATTTSLSTTVTSSTTTTTASTTTDVTLTDREPTYRFKILAESELNVSVRLTERSGRVAYNRTHRLDDSLVLDLSDEFVAGTTYNATVWVNDNRTWQATIPSSYRYRLLIDADGNVTAYRETE